MWQKLTLLRFYFENVCKLVSVPRRNEAKFPTAEDKSCQLQPCLDYDLIVHTLTFTFDKSGLDGEQNSYFWVENGLKRTIRTVCF